MPVNIENVKKAFNSFQDDDFLEAKKILKQEIKVAKNDFLKDKLGIKKDIDKE